MSNLIVRQSDIGSDQLRQRAYSVPNPSVGIDQMVFASRSRAVRAYACDYRIDANHRDERKNETHQLGD